MTYLQFFLTILLLHSLNFFETNKTSFATYSLIEADQILTWNHQLLIWFLCSIHWINWIQKLKLKIYFFVDILTFYTLLIERTRNSILLRSGLNPAWHFWLSTRFSCSLKMKSVENILGYIWEQFYRFSSRKSLKLFKKIH